MIFQFLPLTHTTMSELEQHQYDPDKAKFYANKAGGVKVPLHCC